MAKLKMKKIWICAMKKDAMRISHILQVAGVVDLTTVDGEKETVLDGNVLAKKSLSEKYVKICDEALEIFDTYSKDEKKSIFVSFEGPKVISVNKFEEKVKNVKDVVIIQAI